MKEQIVIKVERPSSDPSKPYIKVFEKIVDSDSSIQVPYQTIVDSFRFLYGFNVVISISSVGYWYGTFLFV